MLDQVCVAVAVPEDSRSEVKCEVMSDDEGQRERGFRRVIGQDRLVNARAKLSNKRKMKTRQRCRSVGLLRYGRPLHIGLTELSALSADTFFLKRGIRGGGGDDNSGSLSPSSAPKLLKLCGLATGDRTAALRSWRKAEARGRPRSASLSIEERER